jgi:hypothetical protein
VKQSSRGRVSPDKASQSGPGISPGKQGGTAELPPSLFGRRIFI